MKRGMEPFLVLNRTISSKSVEIKAEFACFSDSGFSCQARYFQTQRTYLVHTLNVI